MGVSGQHAIIGPTDDDVSRLLMKARSHSHRYVDFVAKPLVLTSSYQLEIKKLHIRISLHIT